MERRTAGPVARTSRALGAGGGEHRDAAWLCSARRLGCCQPVHVSLFHARANDDEYRRSDCGATTAFSRAARGARSSGSDDRGAGPRADGAATANQWGECGHAGTAAAAATGCRSGRSQRRESDTASETGQPYSRGADARFANRGRHGGGFSGSIRIPGTQSALKLGGQARVVAVHTLNALGTEDWFVTSSIPVGIPESWRRGAHGLHAHRESLEHRASDAESARADALVHRN